MLKQANLSFSVTAQAHGNDTNAIQFSTQDKKTAKLIFTIKEGKAPLNLTDIDGEITLVMQDKSRFVGKAEVTKPLDGILEYTLTQEQIRHAGRAQGEVILKAVDGSSVGGFRFTFTIKKALMDENLGPVKEFYINDLEAVKQEVQKKADAINIDIDSFKENVDQRTSVIEETITQLEEGVTESIVVQVETAKKDTSGQAHADLDSRISADVGKVTTALANTAKKINWYTPKDFGAKGNGAADDSDALISAFSTAKYLDMRGGKYLLSKPITITQPITILSNGYDGAIWLSETFPDNVDVITIQPTGSFTTQYHFDNLFVFQSSNLPVARDIFRIINNSSIKIQNLTFSKCDFRALNGGYAINIVNPSSNVNPNGVFGFKVTESVIYGGIKAENLGDSCWIDKNNIKGKNIGIDISMVNEGYGSASQLSIEENNIVNDDGAIYINGFRQLSLNKNNIEQQKQPVHGAAVVLTKSYEKQWTNLGNNKIEPLSPNSYSGGIKLNNVQNVTIESSYVGSSAILDENYNVTGGTTAIELVNCKDISIKSNNQVFADRGCMAIKIDSLSERINTTKIRYRLYDGSSATINDSGKATIGIVKDVPSTWIANSTSDNALQYYIADSGVVTLRGRVKDPASSSNIASGTVIGNLPVGVRPSKTQHFVATWLDLGGGTKFTRISVTSSGQIVINENLVNFLTISVSGISFVID